MNTYLRKILVVEDNEINRNLLCDLLSDIYETVPAENGQVALDILRKGKQSISVILLDISMPVMDGYEFLSIVKADEILSNIPVIVMTQPDHGDEEIKALTAGATDFISKPYNAELIRHRIAALIKLMESTNMINLVQYDKKTGVLSTPFFYESVRKTLLMHSEKQYDIICSDIENFKLVNDLFGENTGDKLLHHVAIETQKFMGPDSICGRISGDVFVALVEHRQHYTSDMFDALIQAINEFPISYHITLKYGVCPSITTEIGVSSMCDRAILALRTIKGQYGQNVAIYDEDIRQNLLAEQVILDNMEEAIEDHQFQIYLQPKYDIRSETIAGAEALVRWIHPTLGFMSPGAFIPLFERNGFISTLDQYIWEEVCRFLRDFKELGYPSIPISVNMSRADIYNLDLPTIFESLIKQYDIDPKLLHIEITESAYTQNPNQIIETLNALREKGFIIEMDDFGSGYSSLGMLSELPVDIIKLDMTFIQTEMKKSSDKSIISFIASLAKWMNKDVIAEGVETKSQLERLRNTECNYVQGFYFSRPLPRPEFEEILQKDAQARLETSTLSLEDNSYAEELSIPDLSKTMLIVEDSVVQRKILVKQFEKEYSIIQAEDGQEAYMIVEKQWAEIDVILLDLVMPIMNGFQFLEKIHNNPDIPHIPVVITSQGVEDKLEELIRLGACSFANKPFEPKIVSHQVHCAIGYTLYERQQSWKRQQIYLAKKEFHDCPTGFYNLEGFYEASLSLRQREPGKDFTLFSMEIPGLRMLPSDDPRLPKLGKILRSFFRSEDILCRYDQYKFIVLSGDFLPHDVACLKIQELQQHLDKIEHVGKLPKHEEAHACYTGITTIFYHEEVNQAVKRADKALYQAKNSKDETYVYY